MRVHGSETEAPAGIGPCAVIARALVCPRLRADIEVHANALERLTLGPNGAPGDG